MPVAALPLHDMSASALGNAHVDEEPGNAMAIPFTGEGHCEMELDLPPLLSSVHGASDEAAWLMSSSPAEPTVTLTEPKDAAEEVRAPSSSQQPGSAPFTIPFMENAGATEEFDLSVVPAGVNGYATEQAASCSHPLLSSTRCSDHPRQAERHAASSQAPAVFALIPFTGNASADDDLDLPWAGPVQAAAPAASAECAVAAEVSSDRSLPAPGRVSANPAYEADVIAAEPAATNPLVIPFTGSDTEDLDLSFLPSEHSNVDSGAPNAADAALQPIPFMAAAVLSSSATASSEHVKTASCSRPVTRELSLSSWAHFRQSPYGSNTYTAAFLQQEDDTAFWD